MDAVVVEAAGGADVERTGAVRIGRVGIARVVDTVSVAILLVGVDEQALGLEVLHQERGGVLALAVDDAGHEALAAQAAGELTALNVLCRLGRCTQGDRDSAAQSPQRILRRERRIRPFLDQWFRPADHFRVPPESETETVTVSARPAGE